MDTAERAAATPMEEVPVGLPEPPAADISECFFDEAADEAWDTYLAALDRAFEGALAGGALGLLVRAQRPSGTLLETLVTPSLETGGAWRVSRVADGTPLGHGEGLAKAQVLEELRAIPAPVTATAFV